MLSKPLIQKQSRYTIHQLANLTKQAKKYHNTIYQSTTQKPQQQCYIKITSPFYTDKKIIKYRKSQNINKINQCLLQHEIYKHMDYLKKGKINRDIQIMRQVRKFNSLSKSYDKNQIRLKKQRKTFNVIKKNSQYFDIKKKKIRCMPSCGLFKVKCCNCSNKLDCFNYNYQVQLAKRREKYWKIYNINKGNQGNQVMIKNMLTSKLKQRYVNLIKKVTNTKNQAQLIIQTSLNKQIKQTQYNYNILNKTQQYAPKYQIIINKGKQIIKHFIQKNEAQIIRQLNEDINQLNVGDEQKQQYFIGWSNKIINNFKYQIVKSEKIDYKKVLNQLEKYQGNDNSKFMKRQKQQKNNKIIKKYNNKLFRNNNYSSNNNLSCLNQTNSIDLNKISKQLYQNQAQSDLKSTNLHPRDKNISKHQIQPSLKRILKKSNKKFVQINLFKNQQILQQNKNKNIPSLKKTPSIKYLLDNNKKIKFNTKRQENYQVETFKNINFKQNNFKSKINFVQAKKNTKKIIDINKKITFKTQTQVKIISQKQAFKSKTSIASNKSFIDFSPQFQQLCSQCKNSKDQKKQRKRRIGIITNSNSNSQAAEKLNKIKLNKSLNEQIQKYLKQNSLPKLLCSKDRQKFTLKRHANLLQQIIRQSKEQGKQNQVINIFEMYLQMWNKDKDKNKKKTIKKQIRKINSYNQDLSDYFQNDQINNQCNQFNQAPKNKPKKYDDKKQLQKFVQQNFIKKLNKTQYTANHPTKSTYLITRKIIKQSQNLQNTYQGQDIHQNIQNNNNINTAIDDKLLFYNLVQITKIDDCSSSNQSIIIPNRQYKQQIIKKQQENKIKHMNNQKIKIKDNNNNNWLYQQKCKQIDIKICTNFNNLQQKSI